jgi:hypothetical protein
MNEFNNVAELQTQTIEVISKEMKKISVITNQ